MSTSVQSSATVKTVVEQPDPEAVKKAMLAKVKHLRAHALFGRGAVKKGNPAMHYIWVNINENRQVDFKSMGYDLCKDPTVETAWKRPDGTHQRGDLILYEIPKDLHEAIKADEILRAYEAVDAPKQALHTTVVRSGAAIYEPTPR